MESMFKGLIEKHAEQMAASRKLLLVQESENQPGDEKASENVPSSVWSWLHEYAAPILKGMDRAKKADKGDYYKDDCLQNLPCSKHKEQHKGY